MKIKDSKAMWRVLSAAVMSAMLAAIMVLPPVSAAGETVDHYTLIDALRGGGVANSKGRQSESGNIVFQTWRARTKDISEQSGRTYAFECFHDGKQASSTAENLAQIDLLGIDPAVNPRYSIGFDFRILTGVEYTPENYLVFYFMDESGKRAGFARINSGNLELSKTGNWLDPNDASNAAIVPVGLDEWHNLEYVMDTQNKTFEWFVDGVKAGDGALPEPASSTGSTTGLITKILPAYCNQTLTAETDCLYMDHIKTAYVEKVTAGSPDINAAIRYRDFEDGEDFTVNTDRIYMSSFASETDDSVHKTVVYPTGTTNDLIGNMNFWNASNMVQSKYLISFDFKKEASDTGVTLIMRDKDSQDFLGMALDKDGYFGTAKEHGWKALGKDGTGTVKSSSFSYTKYIPGQWQSVDMIVTRTSKPEDARSYADEMTATTDVYLNGNFVGRAIGETKLTYTDSTNTTVKGGRTYKPGYIGVYGPGAQTGKKLKLDNIRLMNITGESFYCTAELENEKIVLNFTEAIVDTDVNKLKLYKEDGTETAVQSVVRDGHKVVITPGETLDYYQIVMPEHTLGTGGNLLTNRTVEVERPRFTVKSGRITANGSEIPAGAVGTIAAGAEIKFEAEYSNTTQESQTVFSALAAYGSDKRLLAVDTAKFTVEPGQAFLAEGERVPALSSPEGAAEYCAFVWDNSMRVLDQKYKVDNLSKREVDIHDAYVKQLGRYTAAAAGGRTYNYPNSGIAFSFSGTEAEVYVTEVSSAYNSSNDAIASVPTEDDAPYFNIIIDNGAPRRVAVKNTGWMNLVSGLDNSREHTISFVRSGEATRGKLSMSKLRVTAEADPKPAAAKARKIEFYGDSYTVGYGNLYQQDQGPAWETGKNTDHYQGYAAITARAFDAEANVIARSGMGLSTNNGGDSDGCISQQIDFADLKIQKTVEPEAWDFTKYTPDLVVVFLGTNDYSAYNKSEASEKPAFVAGFQTEYMKFLTKIRSKYPDAKILCLAKPSGSFGTEIAGIVDALGGANNNYYFYQFSQFSASSLGHPSAAEHAQLAEELIGVVEDMMNWSGTVK